VLRLCPGLLLIAHEFKSHTSIPDPETLVIKKIQMPRIDSLTEYIWDAEWELMGIKVMR